jgi:hypothetical protein
MNATALLLLIVGIFIVLNAPNFVGVLNHTVSIGRAPTNSGGG